LTVSETRSSLCRWEDAEEREGKANEQLTGRIAGHPETGRVEAERRSGWPRGDSWHVRAARGRGRTGGRDRSTKERRSGWLSGNRRAVGSPGDRRPGRRSVGRGAEGIWTGGQATRSRSGRWNVASNSEPEPSNLRSGSSRGIGAQDGSARPGGGQNPTRGAAKGEANHRTGGTLLRADQGLEVEGPGCGSRPRTESTWISNGTGAQPPDEGAWLHEGRSP
jgi:hypothetical protein